MNKPRIQINEKITKQLKKKYSLRYLTLFGSQSNKTAKGRSDCDVAYSSSRNLNYGEEVFLAEDIARALKVSPDKIDLVNTKNAGPLLAKEIATNGIVLKEFIPDSYDNFQIYALMQYFEAQPLFRLKEEFVKRNIK